MSQRLRGLITRGVMSRFLNAARANPSPVVPNAEVFIAALFSVDEELADQMEMILVASDALAAVFLIRTSLSTSRCLPVHRWSAVRSQNQRERSFRPTLSGLLGKGTDGAQSGPIPKDDLKALGPGIAERIRGMAARGDLATSRHLVSHLYNWSEYGAASEAGEWAEEYASTPAGLVHLLKVFRRVAADNGHPLGRFINIGSALDRAGTLVEDQGLAPADRAVLRSFLANPLHDPFDRGRGSEFDDP